ncbi:MAG: hypothetical protein LBF59_09685 [Prevotellaceae bacterium]|jgi:hypothetical protein|nr:hypothetical protein [Prevotellaceae bacterium]
MRLCENKCHIKDVGWFREVRKLSDCGHQTAIITTNPELILTEVALKMFARWSQENFFKYMIANFDFDKMIEYGTQELKNKSVITVLRYALRGMSEFGAGDVNSNFVVLFNDFQYRRVARVLAKARVHGVCVGEVP